MHDLTRLMMRKQVKRAQKCVYPFTHIPILVTPLQNWMIAENHYHIVITNGLLIQATSNISTRQEIFRFNQICYVVELVQSICKYNFLMVLCEDCQSQTLFVVHHLKFLTSPIDHSQFNYMYIQKIKKSQMTHFSTQKLRRQRFFHNYPILH